MHVDLGQEPERTLNAPMLLVPARNKEAGWAGFKLQLRKWADAQRSKRAAQCAPARPSDRQAALSQARIHILGAGLDRD